ncbi:hypothetical protein L3Y34_008062 [Caenorhabditis briggsae]|nr:hypothetical protein L3Y34_008062 [Caenorhabditis briggsae]
MVKMLFISPLLFFLLFFLIPAADSTVQPNVTLLTLGDLWETRGMIRTHLFPTKTSTVYPEFAAIPSNQGDGRMHLTRSALNKAIENVAEMNGVLIHSICSYRHLNVTFYTLNTMFGIGRSEVLIDANMTEMEHKMSEMTDRRIKVNFICVGANNDTYSAVWHHSPDFVWHFIVDSGPIREIIEKDRLQMTRGYYADCFQTYRNDNISRAIIIWRKGFGKKYRIQYGTEVHEMLTDMQRTDLEPVQFASLPRLGQKRPFPRWILWHGDEFTWGNRTIPRDLSKMNHNWEALNSVIEHRMRSYDIPSISIHILRDNKMEYSASYGFADILQSIPVKTTHRYRIASVSKLITAMTIGELLADYKHIDLLTPVFGPAGVLSDVCSPCHPFLLHVRIIHLLEHSSGAWPHTSKFEFDRMEQNQTEFLMRVVQKEFPILFPGGRHMYSNIGYILLGRIIEKVSGRSYEEYALEKVLNPLGVNATIGKEGDPFEEVTYYSHDNANAYTSWSTRRLNSAAGWAMKAEDVTKVFHHLEEHKLRRFRWIITPSAVRWNYGRGVQLGNDGSLYHIGSLAGTEAIGYTWQNVQVAILTNIRGKEQNEQTGWMEKLCKSIADGRFTR